MRASAPPAIPNPRKTMPELEREFALPRRIDSLEEAKCLAIHLQEANFKLNEIYVEATAPRYPDGLIQPYAPGEARQRDECLEKVHALQAQALAWRLAELFEGYPLLNGFRYKVVKRPKGALPASSLDSRYTMYMAQMEAIDTGGGLRACQSAADLKAAEAIAVFFSDIPDLILGHAHEANLARPKGRDPLAEMMRALRPQLAPASFAYWESGALEAAGGAKRLARKKRAPRL